MKTRSRHYPTGVGTGFTLVELLFVVGVIAILAIIAIPHLHTSQVRAKVSRTRADLRSLSVGIDMYQVDNNLYPDVVPTALYKAGLEYSAGCLRRTTTPIAYLTNSNLQDSFSRRQPVVYVNIRAQVEQNPSVIDLLAPGLSLPQKAELVRHEYTVVGVGPDGVFENELVGDKAVIEGLSSRTNLSSEYDPTNGTMSGGDIARTALGPW